MKYCPNCGAQLPDGTKFCQECGQKVAVAAPAPAQPSYEAPAPQSYEAPQQSYTPPVQQSYEAPQQSYTPPEPQSYEAPQQSYTPPVQQSYEAPQQSYTPPQHGGEAPTQTYVPPTQSGNSGAYVPPAAPAKPPKEKKPGGSKKLALFIGIGVAVVALVVVLVVLLFNKGGEEDPNLGRYTATSCTFAGIDAGTKGEWIELKGKGKADLFLMGDSFSATWTLEGETFTLKQSSDEFAGTLKNGVLSIDFGGMLYTFEKEGGTSATTGDSGATGTTGKPDKTGTTASEAGYWTLLRVDSSNADMAISEEDLAMFRGLGIEFYMDLSADGTAVIVLDEPVKATWSNGTVAAEDGSTFTYTLKDDQLHADIEGADYVFTRGKGSAPEIDWGALTNGGEDGNDPDEGDGLGAYDWWSGKWYGWVVISNGNSPYSDSIGNCDDCIATIDVYSDDTGYISLSFYDGESLGWANVAFGPGITENGCMMSEDGSIFDMDIAHADWIVDPGASVVSVFDHMICIDGTIYDEDGDWFSYAIYMRPWGMKWEDVRTADTSAMPYSDMMPLYYDSWYLPQI